MDLSNLVLSISGILIVMLLGIIGFFLKKQITVVECLTDSVNALNVSMELVRNNESNFRLTCGLRHTNIDKTMDNHKARLDKHANEIALLQENRKTNTHRK